MSIVTCLQNEASLDNTFAKGLALALDGGVLACEEEPSAIMGTVRLSGSMEGSHGQVYRTRVSLDLDDEAVVDYSCSCPAAYNYNGMCKHEIALALHYLDATGIAALPSPGTYGTQAARPAGGARPKTPAAPRALPTSSQISNLLSTLTQQRVDEVARTRHRHGTEEAELNLEPADFDVSIIPPSSPYGFENTLCLRLKVRRGKASYVVKNMGELVHAWKTGAQVTHGKNLTLAYLPGNLTERACKLLDLITRIVDTQQALFSSRWQYMQAGRGTDIKELPLSPVDAIDVLDLMQGESIAFGFGYSYGQGGDLVCQVEVLHGNPTIEAEVRPAGDGGFDLRLPSALQCLTDGERMYIVDEAHAWRCSEEFARVSVGLFSSLLPARGALHIGTTDLGDFCRTVLPTLRGCTHLVGAEALDSFCPPVPEFSFKVGMEDGEVTCRATVAYDDWRASLYEPQRPGQPARDLVAEYHVQDIVEEYFPSGNLVPGFDESDDELLYVLLTDGLAELGELGDVMVSERLRAIKAQGSPQVRVKATLKSGLLDLQVDASGMSPRDLMLFLDSYKRKQKFVRLSSGDIVKLGDSLREVNALAESLGVDAVQMAGDGVGLPSNRTLFVDALLKKASGVRLERNAAFREVVRDFDTYGDADFDVPASLSGVLRPYQEEGFRWLETLERFGFGGILADDMGLGKTLQVIAHILARKEAGSALPSLVVCPASLVYNWMAELARFAPQLDAAAVVGTKAVRIAVIGAATSHDVLVTSYDLLKRDIESFADIRFARAVLDEAHYIKNPGTQVAKAVKCLQADSRLALTGTPIENRLIELWSIFDFLMPGILGSMDSFSKRFAGPVEAREGDSAHRLQCMVAPFILRRLKTDVLADLPEKNESVVYARMAGEQDKLYKANQDRLALQLQHENTPKEFKENKLKILAELTKLRQICCDPRLFYDEYAGGSAKLDTCMELLHNAMDGGHKVLLFSQFTSMLTLIEERLVAAKIASLTLTGATSKEERARLVDTFQTGDVPVFLISLKAGGVGLNLTAADVVIHYDPWWNVSAQNQATDRAHRIGQTRAVSVFKLICQDTIEERILQMQERKHDLAESVLGGEGVGSTTLSREDVLALLDHEAE